MQTLQPLRFVGLVLVTLALLLLTGCSQQRSPSDEAASPLLLQIQLSPKSSTVAKGTVFQLIATGIYQNNIKRDISDSVSWDVSSQATLSQIKAGQFKASQSGQATITASLGQINADASITVSNAKLRELQIAPLALNIATGTQTKIQAIGIFDDGSKQDLSSEIVWQISPSGLASIDESATLLANQAGTATLTASYSAGSQMNTSTAIEIYNAALQEIIISAGNNQLASGTSSRLTATGLFENGQTQDITGQVEWAVMDAEVIELGSDDEGVQLKAKETGQTTITASLANISASEQITVTDAKLEGIEIISESNVLAKGVRHRLMAMGLFSDGSRQDISRDVIWSSKNTDIVSVDNSSALSGEIHAISIGETEIVAIYNELYDIQPVEVTAAVLTALIVSADQVALPAGMTAQLHALGVYSDGSKTDLTFEVTWLSSDPDVAGIDNGGIKAGHLIAKRAGISSISASMENISRSLQIKVSDASLTNIVLETETRTIPNGVREQIRAIGIYSDNSKQDITDQVFWRSSNSEILTVSNLAGDIGQVLAKDIGSSEISAQAGDIEATITLSVTQAALVEIIINLPPAGVGEDNFIPITATGIYDDGSRFDISQEVSWSTDADSTNIVIEDGQVYLSTTPDSSDPSVITATLDTISESRELNNPIISLASIFIEPVNVQLAAGFSQDLVAIGQYSDGSRIDLTTQVTWQSEDSAIASVNSEGNNPGRLFGLQPGITSLTASYAGFRDTVGVEISSSVLQKLEIQMPRQPWINGSSQQLSVIGVYSDNQSRDLSSEVNWSSSSSEILSIANGISESGLATTLSAGSVTVSASLGEISDSIDLDIQQEQLVRLEISPASPIIAKGTHLHFAVTGIYSNNAKQTLTEQVSWRLDDNSIVVSESEIPSLASLLALKEGNTRITLDLDGIQAETTITVTPASMISLNIEAATNQMAQDTTLQLAAVANFTDSSQQEVTQQVDWSSSDDSIAAVTRTGADIGKITALSPGTANITATTDGITSTFIITVTDANLTQLSIIPDSAVIAPGTSLQMQAQGLFSDGSTQDITESVLWASNAEGFAVVNNGGYGHGLVNATSTSATPVAISASLNGISTTAFVTVTDSELQSLSISPQVSSLPYGMRLPLTATATFADGNTQDLTQAVTWSIDGENDELARVDNTLVSSGWLSTLAPGTINVRAQFNGVESSQTIIIEDQPNAPVALAMAPAPNVIINDGNDESLITIYTRSADASQFIEDGRVISLEIINGEGVLSSESVTTIDGQAQFSLSSTYTGIVTIRARIEDSLVSNTISIYATDQLVNIIGRWVLVDPEIEANTLKTGSRFGLIIVNFSNRPLDVLAFQVANDQGSIETLTDSAYLSDGDLSAGEGTALLYLTEADSSAPRLSLAYLLADRRTGQLFTAGVTLTLNLDGVSP